MAPAKFRRISRHVYGELLAAHGPQHWWPGDSVFEIMVGAVLTQNTAWSNVERAIANLKKARALSARAIVKTRQDRLARWLRPSGYFNVKSKRLRAFCKWIVASGGVRALSKLPTGTLRAALLAVHGVGPETADDILLYAFRRPVFVIDAYTRRLFTRLGAISGSESYESLRRLFETSLQAGEPLYNQYHALIVRHAKDICRPKPRCGDCCLSGGCP